MRNLRQGPGQFHSGGTAPTTTKLSCTCSFSSLACALRQFKRKQHPPPDFQRIFDGLQAGRKRLPLVVAEIGVTRSRGHDQIVVRNLGIRQLDHPARQIEILHFGHQHFDVSAVRRIQRIGAAISPGDNPAVATW